MSFLRAQGSLNGCSCERRGTRALGDDADAAASAVGAQVRELQAQLNRFGKSAPTGLRFVPDPIPVNGMLDANTASHAVAILQWRLVNAAQAFPGESASAITMLKKVATPAVNADPVSYVAQDVAGVTALIQKYGDSQGLPPAQISITALIGKLGDPTALLAIGAGVLIAVKLGAKHGRKR